MVAQGEFFIAPKRLHVAGLSRMTQSVDAKNNKRNTPACETETGNKRAKPLILWKVGPEVLKVKGTGRERKLQTVDERSIAMENVFGFGPTTSDCCFVSHEAIVRKVCHKRGSKKPPYDASPIVLTFVVIAEGHGISSV